MSVTLAESQIGVDTAPVYPNYAIYDTVWRQPHEVAEYKGG